MSTDRRMTAPDRPAADVELWRGDVMRLLPRLDPGAVSLVLADPPYGVALKAHSPNVCTDGTRRNRQRPTGISGDECLGVAMAVIEWADVHDLPLVVFASPYRPLPGEWRNVLVWDKGPAAGGGGDPATCWKRTFELIYTRRTTLRTGRDESVFRVPVGTGADFAHHPCQKPVGLLRYLIRQLTDPGDTVLDPTMGSGSTGVVAVREGRKFIGVEIDETHYATALARLSHAAAPPLFALGGT